MVAMKLLVPPVLREYAGGAELDVSGATVAEALAGAPEALRVRVLDGQGRVFPYLLLFRNDEATTMAAQVEPGDVIEIVAAAEGG